MVNRSAFSKYDFTEPWGLWESRDPLLESLSKTTAFRRLGQIRFLGGIDYLLVRSPNGAHGNIRHTRYQHSMGVVRLALLYCDLRKVSGYDRQHYAAAAMLHDIGHAPLSHSLEPLFKATFGLEHHLVTRDIIYGRGRLGRGVAKVLREFKINVDRVISLIDGINVLPGDDFFSGPINFDTIEGILRSQSYARKYLPRPSPEDVVAAATFRADSSDEAKVDFFWKCKDQVYGDLINSPNGMLADLISQEFMRRNIGKFGPDDYLSTEPEVFKKLNGLRDIFLSRTFTEDALRLVEVPTKYKVRKFFVYRRADFFRRDDLHRYRQRKLSVKFDKEFAIEASKSAIRDFV
jgi:uncharacterized protein